MVGKRRERRERTFSKLVHTGSGSLPILAVVVLWSSSNNYQVVELRVTIKVHVMIVFVVGGYGATVLRSRDTVSSDGWLRHGKSSLLLLPLLCYVYCHHFTNPSHPTQRADEVAVIPSSECVKAVLQCE